jgi:ankyrin repeat protein
MGTTVGLLASVLLVAGVAQAAQPAGDVNAQAADGATALLLAAYDGDAAQVAALLKAGADPESPNPEGQTALMAVARTGNVEAAKLLLSHGANINAREKWGGQTALIWAAAQGQAEMLRFLSSKGADVNVRSAVRDWQRKITAEGRPKDMNRGGLTALLYAAREGHVDCIRELARARADLNLADPDGTTPLVLALMNGHWDAAKLLIESGADVDQWDFYGQSPLYVAVDIKTIESGGRVELPTYDKATAHDIIQLLLEKGANPNLQLKLRPPFRNVPQDRLADPMLTTGATPLLRAAKAGDADSVKLLLDHGALVDLRNVLGHSPLMAAAGSGRGNVPTRGRSKTEAQALETIRLLKGAGADVNARAVEGDTAVHGAAIKGWNEVIKLLASAGANLDVADKDGMTPIDYALARYPLNYLEPKPVPHESTAALLKSLGATQETPNPPAWPPKGVPQNSAQVPQLPY